jgi:catechol 2,3-dioxygenase-like lactoylglutathione lyase family enzyme
MISAVLGAYRGTTPSPHYTPHPPFDFPPSPALQWRIMHIRPIAFFALLTALAAPAYSQQPARPAITGIAFMRVFTSDPAGAQRFYGDTLGYQRQQQGGNWIYPVNSAQWVEVVPHLGPEPNSRMAAIAFTTRDAAALERYLQASHVPIAEPLHAGQFSVHDPEGNLVIFVQAGSEKLVRSAPASPKATSERIIHVGFIAVNKQKEDNFWQTILGFKPYWHGGQKSDADTDYVSLQVPDGTDWLEYMLNHSPSANLHDHGMMDHFSLGVTKIDAAVTRLAANHCEGNNCTRTQLGRDGKMQLNLFDPDQTRVEYMEFKPVQQPCCSPFTGPHPTLVENK